MTTTTIQHTAATAQALDELRKSLTLTLRIFAKVVYHFAALFAILACQAWRWLNTSHTFGDDSEAVTLSGWQYIGVCVMSFFACLVFSLSW